MNYEEFVRETNTRRTFAIISHPDAGKTTITEKLLLFGRLIQKAGTVKGKVWFAMKGDKMYRITINWFTGEEKDFLPIFEKSVASFKFK